MKIITDRINSFPPHSITKKEIETILMLIPYNYNETVIIFKISAQLISNSKWDRPVIQNSINFNILSRGFTKREIVKELLIEIFSHNSANVRSVNAHKLNAAQRKLLEEMIAPYFIEICKRLQLEI